MSEKILIVEDDDRLAVLIQTYLSRHGYEVSCHSRGDTAETIIQGLQPDLVILDVMLPGKSGFDICRDIREKYFGLILFMTASDDNVDEIVGLELGSDDYLSKPVEPRLLLARIRALLRRKTVVIPFTTSSELENIENKDNESFCSSEQILSFNQLVINNENRKVILDSIEVDFTTAEFDLLWFLASHAGQILSRDDIFAQIRGIDFDGTDRSIDARISRLRRKLMDHPDTPNLIKTVRGKGYLFMKEGEGH